MNTIADRVLEELRTHPLDDDVLAIRLGVPQWRSVNHVTCSLESQGRLRRYLGPNGKILNELVAGPVARTG